MENPEVYFVARFAAALLPEVYDFLNTLPDSERFNLTSQMQRSAGSIDFNIREGASRQDDKAMMPFLYYANGSAGELYGQFKATRRLGVGDQPLAKVVGRKAGRLVVMLARLIESKEKKLGLPPRRRRYPRRTK